MRGEEEEDGHKVLVISNTLRTMGLIFLVEGKSSSSAFLLFWGETKTTHFHSLGAARILEATVYGVVSFFSDQQKCGFLGNVCLGWTF